MKCKMMKVFDCSDIPDDIRESYFNIWEDSEQEEYIEFYSLNSDKFNSDYKVIYNWLLNNGMLLEDDVVLIKNNLY